MRYALVVLSLLFWTATSSLAQVSVGVGIGLPGVSIGINVPTYPEFVQVPGYPVYYAPRLRSNYFFYDGMYWVYADDNWYASYWYNGPWALVAPEVVPVFVLRIPVRYYRAPPAYFRGWRSDAPPRWGQHWGQPWEQRRSGWDRWDRRSAPAPAPLPVYQRQYSGDRYPRAIEQQQTLQGQRYRYQPRDTVVRQNYQEYVRRTPATSEQQRQEAPRVQQQRAPQETTRRQQEIQRSSPPAPQPQAPAPAAAVQQKAPAVQEQKQPPASQREQSRSRQESAPQDKGKGAAKEPRRGQGEKDREREERERGERK